MPVASSSVLRSLVPADLERARGRIPWVGDDDLREIDRRSSVSAFVFSFFTWGGGHLLVRDYWKGAALLAGFLGFLIAGGQPWFPDWAVSLGWFGGGVVAGAVAFRKARRLNRFVAIRDELLRAQGPGQDAFRLLAAAAPVDPAAREELARAQRLLAAGPAAPAAAVPAPAPGRHAELVDRLRKLAALRAAGVIGDHELAERKVDLLSGLAPATPAELDELLFELLPLGQEGVLVTDDFDFVKRLSGRP